MRKSLVSAAILSGLLLAPSQSWADISYTVKAGDSLWNIGNRYGLTVEEIQRANGLSRSEVWLGETLTLPVNSVPYKVQSGDTLWLIAKAQKTTVDSLRQLNGLKSDSLAVGQTLILRYEKAIAAAPVPPPAPEPPPAPVPQLPSAEHIVAPGENLWVIAQKYKTTMNAILETNMLATDILMPGQKLVVPVGHTRKVPITFTAVHQAEDPRFGDLYDWSEARRIFTVGATAAIRDLATDKSFDVKYYGGSNHADIEPLTPQDTATMLDVFGGSWSWSKKRPVVLTVVQGGVTHHLAASLTGMPHSTESIATNGMDGHCDLYFLNSTGHGTLSTTYDPTHQKNVRIASGLE